MITVDSTPVELRYAIERTGHDWKLPEETMPESRPHDLTLDLLKAVLAYWASGRGLQVGRNLAVRWDEAHPTMGADPDIYVASTPPEGDAVTSLRLWEPGHHPPLVAVEVVSAGTPRKDYVSAPEKYAASGTLELWVFDPLLAGPRLRGGPYRLQVWCRAADGAFVRTYAGEGPTFSRAVGGYLCPVESGTRLRIGTDAGGERLWPTAEEASATKLAELEAEIARLKRGE